MEPIPETSARVRNVYPTEKGASMKTFLNLFAGTSGMLMAIGLVAVLCTVCCVLGIVVIPVAFPIGTPIP